MLLNLACASLGLDCPLCNEGHLCLLEKRTHPKKQKEKKKERNKEKNCDGHDL